jgi:AcrR family transcriptional regulator
VIEQAILDGARQAVTRWGWRGATLERIARAAGVSRVTLYRRGITKERVLRALIEQGVERYRRGLWPVVTGPGSGRQRLERALKALVEAAEADLPLLVALQTESDTPFHRPGKREVLTDTPFTDPLERLLRDGAADGSLRAVHPVETATVLFTMVGRAYVHLRTGHRWGMGRARRGVLDLALNGLVLAPRDPRRR